MLLGCLCALIDACRKVLGGRDGGDCGFVPVFEGLDVCNKSILSMFV